MKAMSKASLVLSCVLFASFGLVQRAAAGTAGYPTMDHASFLVDLPDDWKVDQAEEAGGYVDVSGPTGATISFRTIEGSADDLKAAIQEAEDYLKEQFDNVKLEPAEKSEQRGLGGFAQTGSGKLKDGGAEMGFFLAWYDLKDGKIGEIWYAVEKGDAKGHAAALKILDSFRAP